MWQMEPLIKVSINRLLEKVKAFADKGEAVDVQRWRPQHVFLQLHNNEHNYVSDTWIKPCSLGEDNTCMQEEEPFNRTLCNICMYSVIFVEDVYTQCAHTHVQDFIARHVLQNVWLTTMHLVCL